MENSTDNFKKDPSIVISGGFDPLHPGHVAMIEAAREYGELHIMLYSDDLIVAKKGFCFQPYHDRELLLKAYTQHIHKIEDLGPSIEAVLESVAPAFYGRGEAIDDDLQEELTICLEHGVELVHSLGGTKYASSTEINSRKRVMTRWGWYDVIVDMPLLKVKVLHILAGKKLSLQKHSMRSEFFFMPNGEVRMNLPGVWHAPTAPNDSDLTLVEVQVGISNENDIERILETEASYEEKVDEKIFLNK